MKSYGMLGISSGDNTITIFCSEPDILEEFRGMIEQNEIKITVKRETRFHYVLDTEKVNSREAYAWVIQYFCRNGWEPYGFDEALQQNAFRKEL